MTIAMLLSGGVDSSTALYQLAHEEGREVRAFYLKIWLEDELKHLGNCPWEEDLRFARTICERLNVPLEIVPLQTEYWERVVSYTIEELKAGRTPSPDIFCNQRIKFGAFLDQIDASFEKISSGHYASTFEVDGEHYLERGIDPIKDQSYFLSHLRQDQLRRCLFPLGKFMKSEVRDRAQKWNLANRDRPDSQGICFLGKIPYREFVKFHLGVKKGKIVDIDSGKTLGEHEGFWFHTIGQRKGLGLSGGPWFVTAKNLDENIVYVSHFDTQEDKARDEFFVENPHWINYGPQLGQNLQCKIRHGVKLLECEVSSVDGFLNRFKVKISEPDMGLAPGQFCVFYDKLICLGGGMIC